MKRYRIREQMNGITEPPGKVWFWELEAGVIHADRCIQCGTCVAVCPSNSIGVNEDTDLPELVKMCTGCSLCWDFCPRRAPLRGTVAAVGRGEWGRGRGAARAGPFRLLGHVLEDQRRPAGGGSRRGRRFLCGQSRHGNRRCAGRRRGQRPADRPPGRWRDRRRARLEAERRSRRAVEGHRDRLRQRRQRSRPLRAVSTTRPWRWPSSTCPATHCRRSRVSPSSVPRARCRDCGRCRPGVGPRARTGSMRWC